jgi:cbb3-type cytochrome oxidase subunit 3
MWRPITSPEFNFSLADCIVSNVICVPHDHISLFYLSAIRGVSLENSLFENLTTSLSCDGVVLFLTNFVGSLHFSHNIFRNISGLGAGGVCYFGAVSDGVNANIINCSFFRCSTSSVYGGGALFMAGAVKMNITNCLFSSCSAPSGKGGAIFINGNGTYMFENVTFELGYALSYISNDIYVGRSETMLSLATNFINVCTDVKRNGINYGDSLIRYDSIYVSEYQCPLSLDCSSLDQDFCDTRISCYSNDNTCIKDECYKITQDDCSKRFMCLYDQNGCLHYLSGYCEGEVLQNCETDYCTVYGGMCVYGGCRFQNPKGDEGCLNPCIASNNTCVIEACSKHSSATCLIQTSDVCKWSDGTNRECVPDYATTYCQNLTRNEGECNLDKLCFWNNSLLTVLRCDTVIIRDKCSDAQSLKECDVSLECFNSGCSCQYSGGKCTRRAGNPGLSESSFRIILIVSISGGVVLLIFIVLVFVFVVYRALRDKRQQKNALYSKRGFFDEDGDLNAFYSNKNDFIE